jgi:zinc protease
MNHFSPISSVLLACGAAAGRVLRSLGVAGCLLLLAPLHAQVAANAVRSNIAGIDVIALKTGVKNVITIRGSLPAGNSRSPESNVALARLTAGMLDKGTVRQDKFAIAQKLESVGATIALSANADVLAINAHCLSKDLPLVLSLLAEELRTPAFAPEEFAKLKKQVVGFLKRASDEPDFRSRDAFTRAVYPAGHPNRQPTVEEMIAAVDKAALDEVKAFHAKYYGPAAMRLVIVGDIEPAAVQGGLTQAFAGWTGGSVAPRAARAGSMDVPREQTVFMPEKTSVTITWGQSTGLKYGEADFLALRVGNIILGSGFTGRLMANVRDKEGLTYGIYSAVQADTFNDGDFSVVGDFAPTLLDKGLASTRHQVAEWQAKGVTAEELTRTKTNIAGTYQVGLATTDGMSSTILSMLNRGMDLAWVDQYPAKINALTVADVNSAIKKHVNPDALVLIKAGTVLEAPAVK